MSSEEKQIKQALNFVAELDLLKEQWYEADKQMPIRMVWAVGKQSEIEQKILDIVLDKKRK